MSFIDRFLVSVSLGSGADVGRATQAVLTLPIYIEELESGEGDDEEGGLEDEGDEGDEVVLQELRGRQRQEERHRRLGGDDVRQDHPLQRHFQRPHPFAASSSSFFFLLRLRLRLRLRSLLG